MEDLLSKEHYCYKIHGSLMTSSAYPPSVDNSLYGPPPPPHSYKKNLIPPFYDFSKVPNLPPTPPPYR